jgi:hypothetical protein
VERNFLPATYLVQTNCQADWSKLGEIDHELCKNNTKRWPENIVIFYRDKNVQPME